MKDRPILFSAPMVRAILEGRKTQTRLVVKPQPPARNDMINAAYCGHPNLWLPNGSIGSDTPREWKCPYGQPGDRLWVKEMWHPVVAHGCYENACDCSDVNVQYAADGEIRYFADSTIPTEWTLPKAAARGDVTSLFMPRWASRITLEVTGVRVERLQDISEADARAEGADEHVLPLIKVPPGSSMATLPAVYCDHRDIFSALWESINGAGSWDANPWVWVGEFKRVEATAT